MTTARADDTLTATAPPDSTALVVAPKAAEDVPVIGTPTNDTQVSISAGGQLSTGNSQLAAATVNGKMDLRRGANGFGAALLGNYGQGAPPGDDSVETAENVQGRVRYDRYIFDQFSLFLIVTGRHDKFQGLDFRLNLDPGAKYLFVNTDSTAFWTELGYDFQYDIRRGDALAQSDAMGNPLPPLGKTETDHAARLFFGLKHAFNKEVTFTTGAEYLQSFIDSTKYRFNYDAVMAANVGAGLAIGLGFSARFDHDPLPAKKDWDTATTVSLIYAFSDANEAPAPAAPPTCPCPPPAPPAPPPATAPGSAAPAPAPSAPVTTAPAPATSTTGAAHPTTSP